MTRATRPAAGTFRARNELNELRLADLRFTPQESQAFLQGTVPFPLPPLRPPA